jgi:hypothetical protein
VLLPLGRPFGIVLGGTDMNEMATDASSPVTSTMIQALRAAAVVVAFTEALRDRAERLAGVPRARLAVIPQSVPAGTELLRGADAAWSLRAVIGARETDRVLFLPAAVRAVKDPMLAVGAVEAWHRRDRSVHMVVCGRMLEAGFERLAERHGVREQPDSAARCGVHYLAGLPSPTVHQAMAQASIVLNTSLSEGARLPASAPRAGCVLTNGSRTAARHERRRAGGHGARHSSAGAAQRGQLRAGRARRHGLPLRHGHGHGDVRRADFGRRWRGGSGGARAEGGGD